MTIQEKIDALKKEFETKIAELEKQAKEEEKQSKVWKPKKNEDYWCMCASCIVSDYWDSKAVASPDEERFIRGNIFKTKEEAEWADQHRIVETELKRFVAENDPRPITEEDWEDELLPKYYIRYDYHVKKCNTFKTVCVKFANQVYASTREVLKKAIEHIGEERLKKYYFGVE